MAHSNAAAAAKTDAGDGAWKLWAVGAAAAAAAALGGYLLLRPSPSAPRTPQGGSPSRGGAKKRAARAAAPAAAATGGARAPASRAEEEAFRGRVAQSLQRIQQGHLDGAGERELMALVRAATPADYEPQSRVLVAQWLILFHTIQQMVARNEQEYARAAEEQKGDMGAAWSWLSVQCGEEDLESACDMLKLDVAQRLKDRELLLPIYEKVYAKGERMGDEELLVTFTTAPLLGRWAHTRELGDRIRSTEHLKNTFEEFHRAAVTRPDIPDYKVLYDLAEEEAKNGDTPHDQIKWQQFCVSKLRIRLRDVDCADEAKREKVREGFVNPSSEDGWQTIPVSSETRMLRFGAIAQMLSLSTVPIPMVGPASDTHMKVEGYADLQQQVAPGQPAAQAPGIKQTESYELTRENTDSQRWSGQYYLTQALDAEHGDEVRISFDMEMDLEEVQ